MDSVAIIAAILAWLLVIAVALLRVPGSGWRSLVGPWLALSILTMAVEFIVLFLLTYGLLFFVGREAATVGFILSALILAATPLAWGLILRRRAHRAAASG
jgi:hypothetical protein